MRRAMWALLLAVQGGLAAATAFVVAAFDATVVLRLSAAALALAPLALSLPGLIAGRRATLPWLALALVLYSGFGTVEVIASRSAAAFALLLFALLELAIVLMLGLKRPVR